MPMPTQEADAKREQRGCRAGWSPPAWFLLAALQSLTGDLHSRMLQQAWGYKCLKMKSANTENKGGNNRSQVAYKRHKSMESKDMRIQERILTAGNCWKSNVRWSSCEAPGLWSVCNIFCVSAFLSYLLRPALYSKAQFWIQQKKKQRKRLIINKFERLQVLSNWKLELHSIAKIRLNKLKQFKFISHCNNSAVYPFMQLPSHARLLKSESSTGWNTFRPLLPCCACIKNIWNYSKVLTWLMGCDFPAHYRKNW